MEFSEIGEKLGGLTADQVCELSKFGKDVLEHTGIIGLSSGLQNLIKDMGTKEKKNNKEMTYEEKKQENLKELYGLDYAERTKKALISDKTRATLYVRGMVEDLQCALFSLHTLLYGDYDGETEEELVGALKPVESIVNEYVIDSINENISFRNFKDI